MQKFKFQSSALRVWARGSDPATSDSDLLERVESIFKSVLTADPAIQSNDSELRSVLLLFTPSVSNLDNQKLMAVLTDKEVTSVVFKFEKDKLPGLDSITVDMRQLCWDFVGPMCMRVVKAFWLNALLSSRC